MERNTPTKALIMLSAIMTILARIIHLVLVSAHGLFFLLVGIAQISWGVMVWRPALPQAVLYWCSYGRMAHYFVWSYTPAPCSVLPRP